MSADPRSPGLVTAVVLGVLGLVTVAVFGAFGFAVASALGVAPHKARPPRRQRTSLRRRHRHLAKPRRTPGLQLSRLVRPASLFFLALLGLVVLGTLSLAVASSLGQVRVDAVQSGSMAPRWTRGSAVILEPGPAAAVSVGEAVAFVPPPPYPQVVVVHDVVAIHHVPGGLSVTTRGIANPVDDPWRATLSGTTWHVVVAIPYLGYLTTVMHSWLMRAALLLLVLAALVPALSHTRQSLPARPPAEGALV